MKNRSFDHIVKSKLENYKQAVDPIAWELFEQSQADAIFDQSIQNNISEFHLEAFPRDWDILEEKFESEEVVNDFDALIGSILVDAAINETSDWDSFEKILDHKEDFDSELAAKVRNHAVPLNTSEWPKLSEHLENIERRRRRIVITKFIEAAIFILFVISLMQLYPINNIRKANIYRTVAVNNDLQNNSSPETTFSPIQNKSTVAVSDITSNQKKTISNIPDVSLAQFINANQKLNEVKRTESFIIKPSSVANSIPNSKIISQIAQIYGNNINFLNPDLPSKNSKRDNISINSSNLISSSVEKGLNMTFTSVSEPSNLLATLDISSIDYRREDIMIVPATRKSKIPRGQLWINTYGSPDANFISTPYDDFYKSDGYQNDAYGYSLGASLSYETNNWELEAGLEYGSLNYYPKAIIETTGSALRGYTETTLKEIILDMVEIPLNFKYKFFRKNGWSLYASNGISLGMVASATYDINEESNEPLASAKPGLTFATQPHNYTILDRKEFDEGLLNKGKLKNNVFFSLNTGIGVSKKISESISFYAQPTYHYNLSVSGLGPNNDVHNRLSVQIGTKVRI